MSREIMNRMTIIVPSVIGLTVGLYFSSKTFKSMLLSMIDQVGIVLSVVGTSSFNDGIGEEDEFHRAVNAMHQDTADKLQINNITITEWRMNDGIQIARGTFLSPIAEHLPDEKQTHLVNVEIIIPKDRSWEEFLASGNSMVIQLPLTGDEGFSMRREHIAKSLAMEYGIGSILLQLPFYGARRITTQTNFTLRKAEHMSKQSLAAVMETIAIMKWLTEVMHFKGKLAVTGMSFGGSMAALSSLHCTIPHAVITHVPANTPSDAYVYGGLSMSVNWKKFPRGRVQLDSLFSLMDIGKVAEIIRIHGSNRPISSQTYHEQGSEGEKQQPKRVYIQITAMHDAYIPYDRAMRLYEQMKQLPNLQHCELHLLPGGHGSAILLDYPFYRQCIHDALRYLDNA